MGIEDADSEPRAARTGTAMSFLTYLCKTYKIKSEGTGWQYFREWKQLYLYIVRRGMSRKESNNVPNLYKSTLVPRFGLYPPTLRIKTISDSGDLLALLLFNIAYDRRIFSSEHLRLYNAACYLVLAYTGCRPAEIVDGEKAVPSDGSWDKLFGSEAATLPLEASPDDELPDAHSRRIAKLLEFETESHGCPKVLCYEDVKLQVVRHLETGRETLTMLITFTHHKGSDNRPKPYVSPIPTASSCPRLIKLVPVSHRTIFYFTPTKRLVFCFITLQVVSIAVLDSTFESPTLTSVEAVFAASISSLISCLPLWWKKEWLKRPVFRRCDGDLNSPLPYRTLHDYMGRQSLDMGYERPIHPKDWRRNVGNTVNGLASDAVRDQIMRHNNHSRQRQRQRQQSANIIARSLHSHSRNNVNDSTTPRARARAPLTADDTTTTRPLDRQRTIDDDDNRPPSPPPTTGHYYCRTSTVSTTQLPSYRRSSQHDDDDEGRLPLHPHHGDHFRSAGHQCRQQHDLTTRRCHHRCLPMAW